MCAVATELDAFIDDMYAAEAPVDPMMACLQRIEALLVAGMARSDQADAQVAALHDAVATLTESVRMLGMMVMAPRHRTVERDASNRISGALDEIVLDRG